MKHSVILALCGSMAALCAAEEANAKSKQPNVLFICIDDLRSEIGCYNTQAISPNLDNFASQSSLFTNHFVTVPTSGASRASMLTGLMPREEIDIKNDASAYRFKSDVETETPETMFHLLRRNGYYTVAMGKISHSTSGMHTFIEDGEAVVKPMLKFSWDELHFDTGKFDKTYSYAGGYNRDDKDKQVKPYECLDVEDEAYIDGLTANLAIENLRKLAKNDDQPFCLAVGFIKPHLPFNAPKKYWDMYDENEISISEYPEIPINGGPISKSGEFNSYQSGDELVTNINGCVSRLSDEYARKLRHGYFACISYVDAQVGKVLNELEELGLADDTIIVVWGDHGWHLGDHRVWGKHTILEPSLRSTLIVKTPGQKRGVVNNRIVSSLDIYPTLMDLCGVKFTNEVHGDSFTKILSNPKDKSWKDIAVSFWWSDITLRTPNYRFTSNVQNGFETLYKLADREYESENIIQNHPDIVKQLRPILKAQSVGTASEIKD